MATIFTKRPLWAAAAVTVLIAGTLLTLRQRAMPPDHRRKSAVCCNRCWPAGLIW